MFFITKNLYNKIIKSKEKEIIDLIKENEELKQIRFLEVRNNINIPDQNNKKTELINKISQLDNSKIYINK